jgi:hypothetical protein
MPKSEIEGYYKCCKCGVDKPLSEYHRVSRPTFTSPSQFHVSMCKPCKCEKDRQLGVIRRARNKALVFSHYGRACSCCGEDEQRFLTMDHELGDGAAHRKVIGGAGPKLYAWLVKHNFPAGFRVLCWNCNSSTCNGGVCPHEEARRTAVAAA